MFVRMRNTEEVLTYDQFKKLFPSTSFSPLLTRETLDHFGADPVSEGPQPSLQPWQHAEMEGVEEINGLWFTKYVGRPDEMPEDWLDNYRIQRLQSLADQRWKQETGEVNCNGIFLNLDEKTTNKLDALYLKAIRDENFSVGWKVSAGVFVTLDAPTIIGLGDFVTAHVQACFAHEKYLTLQLLNATTLEDINAINIKSGWPEY